MTNKLFLASAGLGATGLAWLAAKMTSYEPVITTHKISSPVRKGKPPLRLAHVSDFHAGSGIWSPEALNRLILEGKPDLICVTGDHFDPKYPTQEVKRGLISLAQVTPVLFVTGNNDEQEPRIDEILHRLRAGGVAVLNNVSASFFIKEGGVTVFGVRDHKAYPGEETWLANVQEKLREEEGGRDPEGYRIVLGHRPEITVLYDSLRQDLVLCGHAHGGQWRLPKLGGLFAPNQGIFPKYSRGVYQCGKKAPYTMVVSGGFDVHALVPRVNNRPELVFVDIVGQE